MKIHRICAAILKQLIKAAPVLAVSISQAGLFSYLIGDQPYRDFALNSGAFKAGASNIPITGVDGNIIGYVPLMPNFSGVVDIGDTSKNEDNTGALAGGQGWFATVSHDGVISRVSFCERFGADFSSVFYDSYYCVKAHDGESSYTTSIFDFRVGRSSKLVTDAVSWDYASADYMDSDAFKNS